MNSFIRSKHITEWIGTIYVCVSVYLTNATAHTYTYIKTVIVTHDTVSKWEQQSRHDDALLENISSCFFFFFFWSLIRLELKQVSDSFSSIWCFFFSLQMFWCFLFNSVWSSKISSDIERIFMVWIKKKNVEWSCTMHDHSSISIYWTMKCGVNVI